MLAGRFATASWPFATHSRRQGCGRHMKCRLRVVQANKTSCNTLEWHTAPLVVSHVECNTHHHGHSAQVFQGVLLASHDRLKASPGAQYGGSVTTPAGCLLALWRHECDRVFCDKLVSAEDKAWAAGAILELAQCGPVTQASASTAERGHAASRCAVESWCNGSVVF